MEREDQKQGRKVGYILCCKRERHGCVGDVGALQNEKHRSRCPTHNPDPFMLYFDGYRKGSSPSSMRSCVSGEFSLKTLDLWSLRADILAPLSCFFLQRGPAWVQLHLSVVVRTSLLSTFTIQLKKGSKMTIERQGFFFAVALCIPVNC